MAITSTPTFPEVVGKEKDPGTPYTVPFLGSLGLGPATLTFKVCQQNIKHTRAYKTRKYQSTSSQGCASLVIHAHKGNSTMSDKRL